MRRSLFSEAVRLEFFSSWFLYLLETRFYSCLKFLSFFFLKCYDDNDDRFCLARISSYYLLLTLYSVLI